MAKRGLIEHHKTVRLSRLLKCPLFSAVGVLECLFHWTARNARTGKLPGDWSSTLAFYMRFDDEDALFQALVDSGWVDHTEHGFFVHDWAEHADESTKKTLANHGERFENPDGTLLEPFEKREERVANRSRKVKNESGTVQESFDQKKEPIESDSRKVKNDSRKVKNDSLQPVPEPVPVPEPDSSASREAGASASEPPPVAEGESPGGEPPGNLPKVRERSEPYDSIAEFLGLLHTRLEASEAPTNNEIRKHLTPSSPVRQLVEKYGVTKAVELVVWANKHERNTMTFASIWNQNVEISARMKACPAGPGVAQRGGKPAERSLKETFDLMTGGAG